jgi:hypothetical protein
MADSKTAAKRFLVFIDEAERKVGDYKPLGARGALRRPGQPKSPHDVLEQLYEQCLDALTVDERDGLDRMIDKMTC